MGGSRRRLKRGARKVRVGVVKVKKDTKARLPLELTAGCTAVQDTLNKGVTWEQTDTVTENYEVNNFVADPNEGYGRNKRSQPLKSKQQRQEEDGGTHSDDDELRAACNKERKAGKAAPKRLTTHQRQIMEQLIAAHGDDVQAMFRDRKLNRMQHSVGKIRELLAAHGHWAGPQDRHDFRGPRKQPKKLF